MKHLALIFWIGLLFCLSTTYGAWRMLHSKLTDSSGAANAAESVGGDKNAAGQAPANLSRSNLPAGEPIPDFKLTERSGREFDSQSMKGHVWVASYFFASCPAACLQLNQALAGLQTDPDLKDVQFVSITCDPANDTPEVLRMYAGRFAADAKRWQFLTGKLDQVLAIGMGCFNVPVAQQTHSQRAIVLDRNNCIRGYFSLTDADEVDRMRIRLKELLAEPAKSADQGATP